MNAKWIALAIAAAMYALVIAFQEKKVIFSSAAALAIVALALAARPAVFTLAGESAGGVLAHVALSLVNWNVLMIYVGSMAIAALFIYSKVPAVIADSIVSSAPSTGVAITLILAMTGVISIFVENVATVLVMAPIALALCKKLKINPTYFMVGLAVMSNLEGTATLVGDPPSMIFASFAGYTFNDFFMRDGRLSIFFIIQTGMLAGCVFFYVYFARQKEKPSVEKEKALSYFPAALLLAMIFGLAGISFVKTDFKFLSGLFVLSLGAVGVAWYAFAQKKSRAEVGALLRSLDWETIAFLVGIFIVVGAISETGLLDDFARALARATGGNVVKGFALILAVSILISGFIDNVPYIIVMLPVASSLARALNVRGELYMFALLVGACLGGNLTPYGASANVVAMGILKREGSPMNFGGWLKIGGTFTLVTTAAAAAALWLLWA